MISIKWTLTGLAPASLKCFTDKTVFTRLLSIFHWRPIIFVSIGLSIAMHIQCTGNDRMPQHGSKPIPQGTDQKVNQKENSAESTAPQSNSENEPAMRLLGSMAPRDTILIDSLINKIRDITLFSNKVDYISSIFLGNRYNKYGPTGEGAGAEYDTMPLYNLHTFDCVTYIEHVLAIAQSNTVSEFLPHLIGIRYKGGNISYLDRNHFFEVDWLVNNASFFETVHPESPCMVSRTISKKSFFAKKGIDCPISDTLMTIETFCPPSFLSLIEKKALEDGVYVIAFIIKRTQGIFASHVGFVTIKGGRLFYRSASRITGRVSEEDLVRYILKWHTLLEGIILVKIKDRIA